LKNTLIGKTVLITGASSGIGAETAKKVAGLGAKVLLIGRNKERLEAVSEQIRNIGGTFRIFSVDIGDFEAVKEIAEKIKKEIGIPDIIFNNAGSGKWRFIEETEYQDAIDMIKAPYLGAFFITKAFMPEILKRNSGYILNMTSFSAKLPFSGATSYIASRKAMIGFHEALTADLHGTGIKTSLVYFAKVESPFWVYDPESEKRVPRAQKIIRIITAEEAAETIVDGMLKGKKEITKPFMIKIILFLTYLTPCVTRFIMNFTGYKRKQLKA